MLRSLLLFWVCLIPIALQAQVGIFETTYRPEFSTGARQIVSFENGDIVQLGRLYFAGGWGSSQLYVQRLNASGEILWTTNVPGSYFTVTEDVQTHELFAMADGAVLIVGTASGCDYLGGDFIGSIDAEGNISYINDYFSNYNFVVQRAELWLEENIIGRSWSEGSFEYFDYQGISQGIIYSDITYPYDFQVDLESERILVAGNSLEGKKLAMLNSNGEVLTSLDIENYGKVLLDEGGNILFHDGSELKKYDQELSLQVSNSELPANSSYQVELYHSPEYYYVATITGDYYTELEQELFVLDRDLNILASLKFPQFRTLNDLSIQGETVICSISERGHSAIKTFTLLLEDEEPIRDIGISNIQIANIDSVLSGCENPDVYNYTLTDISIEVSNYGEVPVDYFEVNSLFTNECFSICYDSFPLYQDYEEFSLQPGESVTVSYPNLEIPVQEAPLKMRFHTSRPNRLLDHDHSNDLLLQQSSNTEISAAASIKLYPTVARDFVQIETQSTSISGFQVYSASGQLIQESMDHSERQILIDTNDLVKGVYLVEVQTRHGLAETLRFIKL